VGMAFCGPADAIQFRQLAELDIAPGQADIVQQMVIKIHELAPHTLFAHAPDERRKSADQQTAEAVESSGAGFARSEAPDEEGTGHGSLHTLSSRHMVPSCLVPLEPVLNDAFIGRSMLANRHRTICAALVAGLKAGGQVDGKQGSSDLARFRRMRR